MALSTKLEDTKDVNNTPGIAGSLRNPFEWSEDNISQT
jgi:hypothetical protein